MSFPSPSKAQASIIWFGVATLAVGIVGAFLFGAILGLGWLLNQLSPVLMPLAIAGILAYLLDPLVDLLQRRGVPRTRAIILVFFVGVMVVIGLLGTVVPRMVVELGGLIQNTPGYARKAMEKVEETRIFKKLEPLWHLYTATADVQSSTNAPASTTTKETTKTPGTNSTETAVTNFAEAVAGPPSAGKKDPQLLRDVAQMLAKRATSVLPDVADWLLARLRQAAGILGWLLGLALVPIYTFYFLVEKKGILDGWTSYLPLPEGRPKEELIFVLSSVNDSLIVFFRGQVLVALCSGVLLTIGFLSLGMNYAVLLGVMAGMLGIIPYLGVALSLIPATILAAIQFGDWRVLVVPAIFGTVNALEGFVISPKIIGDRVGLHPLSIIIAVVVGTTLLGGILGGVLAIPLTAALRAIMSRYVWHRPDRTGGTTVSSSEAKPAIDGQG